MVICYFSSQLVDVLLLREAKGPGRSMAREERERGGGAGRIKVGVAVNNKLEMDFDWLL